jgi:hypothetical protein
VFHPWRKVAVDVRHQDVLFAFAACFTQDGLLQLWHGTIVGMVLR